MYSKRNLKIIVVFKNNYLKIKSLNLLILFLISSNLISCSNFSGLVEVAVKEKLVNDVIKKKHSNNNVKKLQSTEFITKKAIENVFIEDEIIPNPKYKIGNPYEVKGIWYYPKRDLSYDETGIASWYGQKFHGKLTANGEIFNKNLISAAHKTLPLPSMVKVTNLNNGRVLNIRINDRGPFAHGRIIDLSEKASELLGFKEIGTSRVRVSILLEQSLWLERSAKNGDFLLEKVNNDNNLLPKFSSVKRPKVSIKSTNLKDSKEDIKTDKKSISFTDLLASGRNGNLRSIDPIETKIWIQIGAFVSLNNVNEVIKNISSVFKYDVSTLQIKDQVLHRIRLGPTQDLDIADNILNSVYLLGYKGAKIIVE